MNWMGLNMGFRVSMAAVVLIVITLSAAFWSMKPQKTDSGETKHTRHRSENFSLWLKGLSRMKLFCTN